MTTPTSPFDPPKADLNHDLDNNQKQTSNQADMPGKPMRLPGDEHEPLATNVDPASDDDDNDLDAELDAASDETAK